MPSYTVMMIYDTNVYMPIFDILPSVKDLIGRTFNIIFVISTNKVPTNNL